jgi:hypothetical protein
MSGFQLIAVFDADGRPVAAMLRPARRATGTEARALLRRRVLEIRGHWPRVEILIRADWRPDQDLSLPRSRPSA